ncbi:MAG: DUF4230 domain-containing protein, partial [Candidatus Cloacimonadota bacterium]|nr:DUF4230 domain-containing protein [Candidatus Cloacimonadota bacterium]
MKKFKKYITIVWSTVALLLILVIGYWYYGVSNVETRSSRLIINKISDASLLDTYQSQVDYLIDLELTEDSYFTAIIPFNVTAGVDLEKTTISHQEESKKINIDLPEPQIFKVDQSDVVKPLVLREDNTQNIFDLVKHWKIFAQKKAELDALKKGI